MVTKKCQKCLKKYKGDRRTFFCNGCRTLKCPCGKEFKVGGCESVINTRKHCSVECRDKFGNTHWKGKKLPEETRRRMSEGQKRIGKIPPSWLGKKRPQRSEEHMRKILASRIEPAGENHPNYKGGRGNCQHCNRKLSLYPSQRITNMCRFCWRKYNAAPTSIEKSVYDYLVCKGIVFEKQKEINGKFSVDAYIPSLNLIIEADGKYWHSLPRVVQKDKSKNKYLNKCGYGMLRLSEEEINNGEFKPKIDKIMEGGKLL